MKKFLKISDIIELIRISKKSKYFVVKSCDDITKTIKYLGKIEKYLDQNMVVFKINGFIMDGEYRKITPSINHMISQKRLRNA